MMLAITALPIYFLIAHHARVAQEEAFLFFGNEHFLQDEVTILKTTTANN